MNDLCCWVIEFGTIRRGRESAEVGRTLGVLLDVFLIALAPYRKHHTY